MKKIIVFRILSAVLLLLFIVMNIFFVPYTHKLDINYSPENTLTFCAHSNSHILYNDTDFTLFNSVKNITKIKTDSYTHFYSSSIDFSRYISYILAYFALQLGLYFTLAINNKSKKE
jgi:hypothetical protein